MSPTPSQSIHDLARHEGLALLSASEALLKGTLESELEVSMIAGPRRGAFSSIFDLSQLGPIAYLLRQHGTRMVSVPAAGRAVALAGFVAKGGRAGLALVPNDQLDQTMPAICELTVAPLDRGGAMCIIMEDRPRQSPASCPRHAAARLNLPCLEPSDVGQLRNGVESALRLSRAGRCPIGLVVHTSILRSADTLPMHPNRVLGAVDAILAKRKKPRTPRWAETGGWLRMARRLELNRFRAMPSPGERVSAGFITVGPADTAMQHITTTLGLQGRVPVLQLGLVHPIDESAVGRLLERCQMVIVLEPRPGSIEGNVLALAERMRRAGEQPASIWGQAIPPDPSGQTHSIGSDSDLHPSILVRQIAHVLHAIRPTMQVASQLVPEPPPLPVGLPPRGSEIGSSAALTVVRRMLTDVDQWLRERAHLEERGLGPTALAIDGAEALGVSGRIVQVEAWDHRRFQQEGVAALVQAARDDRPWIMVACEQSEEIRDLERLARGAIPAERADRVKLELGNLAERIALRDMMREAALTDGLTILIVRDGPPPRYDVAAIEQSLAEIDELGFEPRQRLVRSVDELVAMRPPTDEVVHEQRVDDEGSSLQTDFSVDTLASPAASRILVRVRPLFEEVEVVRTKPPARGWQKAHASRLSTPVPQHARQPFWRAHIAGLRREAPGVAAMALCEAGRSMGYHVRSVHDPTAIGPGRRAWAQVLFTHPREQEGPLPLSTAVPYGEADLLLGLDAVETLRAIGPDPMLRVATADRTSAVANVGSFGDDENPGDSIISQERFADCVARIARPNGWLLGDFAGSCRTWFHTDRVADMAILGAAFQMGLIPVSPDAIESAVSAVESRGYGRVREAFDFGRRLAADERMFRQPKIEREEDVQKLTRRLGLMIGRERWGGQAKSRRFSRLVHESLLLMPGLAETDSGRAARRDFVIACHRCLLWGGMPYVQQFAEVITRLYQVDRGDTGRLLTRTAILPLAEAMLIRDPLYIASMALSSEQRRLTRQRLNVKLARGDRIERRYLTRFELIAFNRRVKATIRTSDWPARAAAFARRLMPLRWRGTKRDRDLRNYLIDFMKRAAMHAATDYERWAESMRRLSTQVADNRLRAMAMSELKMLIETSAHGPGIELHRGASTASPRETQEPVQS